MSSSLQQSTHPRIACNPVHLSQSIYFCFCDCHDLDTLQSFTRLRKIKQSCPSEDAITIFLSPQLQHLKTGKHESTPASRVKSERVAAIARIPAQNASNWAMNVSLVCALHILVKPTDSTVEEHQLRCPDHQMICKRSLL
jgi:hypothetical protein